MNGSRGIILGYFLDVETTNACNAGCLICPRNKLERPIGSMNHNTFEKILMRISEAERTEGIVSFCGFGEPLLNPCAMDALEELALRYIAPGLLPCVSTMAPAGCENMLERLLDIRRRAFLDSDFQLQFSIHTMLEDERSGLFGIPCLSLEDISIFGREFHIPGTRKVTLNFALYGGACVDAEILALVFSPDLGVQNPAIIFSFCCFPGYYGAKNIIRLVIVNNLPYLYSLCEFPCS